MGRMPEEDPLGKPPHRLIPTDGVELPESQERQEAEMGTRIQGTFLQWLDDDTVERIAHGIIEQEGLRGQDASEMFSVAHDLFANLNEQLQPGMQLPLDVFLPAGTSPPRHTIYLEQSEKGLAVMKQIRKSRQPSRSEERHEPHRHHHSRADDLWPRRVPSQGVRKKPRKK